MGNAQITHPRWMRPHLTITRDPGLTKKGRRMASQFENRTQPALWARPMLRGEEVPWSPMPDLLKPDHRMPTGLFGPGGI